MLINFRVRGKMLNDTVGRNVKVMLKHQHFVMNVLGSSLLADWDLSVWCLHILPVPAWVSTRCCFLS